jgi:hypothetical protein
MKSARLSVVWLVTASHGVLCCTGQTTPEGGTGGSPAAHANGGTGPWDAGTDGYTPPPDALIPVDVDLDQSSGCPGAITIVEPISAAAPCAYSVPEPDTALIDYAHANVLYKAGDQSTYLIVPNDSATCDTGWHFINNQTQIEICGSPCDTIKNDPEAQLVVMFGCSGPVI